MSHYALAVLTDGTKSVAELMAPYHEDIENGVPDEFLAFSDYTDDLRDEYENRCETLYYEVGDILELKHVTRTELEANPDDYRAVDVPLRIVYPDFETFVSDYCLEDMVEGRVGRWYNVNAKWDWASVGGIYTQLCERRFGSTSIRVGDIRWDVETMRGIVGREYDEHHGKDPYFDDFRVRGMTREQFVESESHLSFRAVLTPDGIWHEVGDMLGFGLSSETPEEMYEWDLAFADRFLSDDDLTLTVVDCHI